MQTFRIKITTLICLYIERNPRHVFKKYCEPCEVPVCEYCSGDHYNAAIPIIHKGSPATQDTSPQQPARHDRVTQQEESEGITKYNPTQRERKSMHSKRYCAGTDVFS